MIEICQNDDRILFAILLNCGNVAVKLQQCTNIWPRYVVTTFHHNYHHHNFDTIYKKNCGNFVCMLSQTNENIVAKLKHYFGNTRLKFCQSEMLRIFLLIITSCAINFTHFFILCNLKSFTTALEQHNTCNLSDSPQKTESRHPSNTTLVWATQSKMLIFLADILQRRSRVVHCKRYT